MKTIKTQDFNLIKDIKTGHIKGAIFDLDGTLIDSMGIWKEICIRYLHKRNISIPKNLNEKAKTMTFEEVASYFKQKFNLPDTSEEIMNKWNDMAFYEYTHNIGLKKGVKEFLTFLKDNDIKIGLATANSSRLLETVLKSNNIWHYFNVVTTIDEVKKGKNHPDIYLLTAQRLRLDPKECVVFEDILPAIIGAKAAGMKVVGIFDESSKAEKRQIIKQADDFIVSFEDYL